jgi:hypothetical protein
MALSTADQADLRYAKYLLENVSLAARIAGAVGTPIEKLFGVLPQGAADAIGAATNKALQAGLRFAISTMGNRNRSSVEWIHTSVVMVTGAAGGAFGLPALAIELPVSTVVMLRSIVDIARSEGELVKTPEAGLACLEVFALGGRKGGDDAAESGYFVVRAALAKALAEAAEYIAERGLAREGAPAIIRFVTQVAARFGIPVSQKVMAQSVPVIGAAGGVVINLVFIDHFQDIARGHFIVRRLERKYGPETVRAAYLGLSSGDLEGGSAGSPFARRRAARRQYQRRSREAE